MIRDKEKKENSQGGFTLIEIIIVLIILGILAVVAVQKFQGLISTAGNKAAEGAVAAGLAQMSMAEATLWLEDGSQPSVSEVATKADCVNAVTGDYTVTCESDGNVTAVDKAEGIYTASQIWKPPGFWGGNLLT